MHSPFSNQLLSNTYGNLPSTDADTCRLCGHNPDAVVFKMNLSECMPDWPAMMKFLSDKYDPENAKKE